MKYLSKGATLKGTMKKKQKPLEFDQKLIGMKRGENLQSISLT